MATIKIKRGQVEGIKADLVKGKVRLTLAFSLNDETLALRDQLASLAEKETRVNVSLSALQIQGRLDVTDALDGAGKKDKKSADGGADEDS